MRLLIGERYRPFLEKSLKYQGIEPLWMPDNPCFDPRLAGHADLGLLCCGKQAVASNGLHPEIVNLLTNRGYEIKDAQGEEGAAYPGDAGLCLCDTGRYLICNPNTADPVAMRMFGRREIIPVKQGYSRCAVCVVNEDSIITADRGIADKARSAGLDVLLIKNGSIELPGFSEGFIGGASIRLAPDKIAFVGSLDLHPDKEAILYFLQRKGVKAVFLKTGALLDIGSAVTLP